jgi:hypothetical protein
MIIVTTASARRVSHPRVRLTCCLVVWVVRVEIDLTTDGSDMEAMATTLGNVEAGLGADGVGHGVLKPPSEELLDEEGGPEE